MITTGVIINPRSGRGRGHGVALARVLENRKPASVETVLLDSFDELEPALSRFANHGISNLFISSGDGTIQAIQTWLGEKRAFRQLPRLALLPHGTTNMTAADLGFQNRAIEAQASMIADVRPTNLHARPTLRIANPRGHGPVHGMFFGTGAVAHATRYCQQAFNDKGIGGNLATFATLASVFGKTLFRRADVADTERFDRPYDISVTCNGQALTSGPQTLVLATTLQKLILGSKPFWGGGAEPLRITTIPFPVPNLWRWVLPTLYGSEGRKAPPGSESMSCTMCEVSTPTDFVLDGEFYGSPSDAPLRLETGPVIEYIRA